MYTHNMELLAHFMPGRVRNGKMQLMSVGNRRYMFQQGDVIDVSDVRKPQLFNKGGFEGGQVQVAYNKNLKKWILMTGAQTPITDSTPEAPMGKYDDPHLDDKRKNYKGLRGVRLYDVTDPSKIVKLSEFSTGATGQGTHRNYYDGGKYAYLDTAPDETFIHQPSYFRQLVNGNMIVDASDPSSAKEVSMWWVPGSRKGEEAEYNKWMWSKLVPPQVIADQTPFAGLHGPVYVPKKLEDGGNRGYGAFGCNGFIILDLSDPSHQKEIGRFEPPPQYSGMGIAFHTIYCGILDRGFVLTNGETTNPTDGDKVIIGNANPTFTLGVRNNATWYNLDASWLWRAEVGGDVFNNTALVYASKGDAKQGRNFLRSALDQPDAINEPSKFSSRWVESRTFTRLQNVTVGYQVPTSLTRGRATRLYLSGDNLVLFTNYTGYDPEVFVSSGLASRGIDYLVYPPARRYTFGARVQF